MSSRRARDGGEYDTIDDRSDYGERSPWPGKSPRLGGGGDGGSDWPGKRPITTGMIQRKAAAHAPAAEASRPASGSPEGAPTGAPLPSALAQRFSSGLGADLSSVRVHTGDDAAASAQSLSARAFTTGQDIYFGAGAYDPHSPGGQHLIAHEVAHTVQQQGASAGPQLKLEVSAVDDPLEHEADRAADALVHGGPVPALSRASARVSRFPMGPIGGGGGSPTPEWQQKAGTAEDYVKKHGTALIQALYGQLNGAAIATGMAGVDWAGGNASGFAGQFSLLFFMQRSDPWAFLVETAAPEDIARIVDQGRDAVTLPDQAQQWNNGVVFELAKLYTRRLTDALTRIVPRYAAAWNQHVLAAEAAQPRRRDRHAPLPTAPEPAEAEVRASSPIDPYVIKALRAQLSVDFARYRELNPAEKNPHGLDRIEPVRLAIQWQEKAINWARADRADATAEDVAAELYGAETFAYLITPAPPLFGFDTSGEHRARLKPAYRSQLATIESNTAYHGSAVPTHDLSSPADRILAGPLGDEAALNQAAGIRATPGISKAAVVERMRHIVGELDWLKQSVARWGQQALLDAARAKVDARSRELDQAQDPGAGAPWDGQTQAQLEVLGFCRNAVQVAATQDDAFATFPSARSLIIGLVRDYVEAAAISDLVATARQRVAAADQRSRMFPADLMDALLDTMRPAIQAAKVDKTGAYGGVGHVNDDRYDAGAMEKKENQLRQALVKVREVLLLHPEQARAEIDRLLAEITTLSTQVSLVSNLDACDAAWRSLHDSLSKVGEVVGWFSDDSGNGVLRADMAAVQTMHDQWQAIYSRWKAAPTPEAREKIEAELQTKARSREWTELFARVGKHIQDTATVNKWVTFGAMVGIAVITGGIGAYAEAAAGAAWGAAAGFAAGTVVEAATFSALSVTLIEKDASLGKFFADFGHNVLMFGALKGIGKIYVGAVGEAVAAEGVGKAGGILVQFAALNGQALYTADQEKRQRTGGKGLTEDEILGISFDNLVFLTAVSVGSWMARPFLTELHVSGELHGQLVAVRQRGARVAGLARAVEAAKGKNAAKAHELNRELGEALAERDAFLRRMHDKVVAYEAGDRGALTEKAYHELKEAMGDQHERALAFQRAQIAALLEPAGPGAFNVAKGQLETVVQHYRTAEHDVAVRVGEPDPVTHARTAEIAPKDGQPWRVTERMSAKEGELERTPETGAATTSTAHMTPEMIEAEALHTEAIRARGELIRRAGQLQAFVLAAAVDGHVTTKIGRVIAGTGLAAAMDANTLPGAQRGAEPAPLAGIPATMGVGTGAETFSKLGATPIGQKATELDTPGFAVQPSRLDANHGRYTSAMTLADATVLTQYRAGLAILDARIIEVSITPDGSWKVADARVRIRVQVDGRDVFLYADATDIATGIGPPNQIALNQVHADPVKAAEYKRTLEGDHRIVYGDDPSVQRGGVVLVSGGSATGAWNAQVARGLGGVVDWIGPDLGRAPGFGEAKAEYEANARKLAAGDLSPDQAEVLMKRQSELRGFGAAMLPRNLEVADSPFTDSNIHRTVKGIESMTPSEAVPGQPRGKVRVTFDDGSSGVYDQVVCSHATNLASPAQPGPAGALTLAKGIQLRPVVVDGKVVALESVDPPGAVRVIGAAMWIPRWADLIPDAGLREVYKTAFDQQAKNAPRDSPANALIHNVGQQIPAANRQIGH